MTALTILLPKCDDLPCYRILKNKAGNFNFKLHSLEDTILLRGMADYPDIDSCKIAIEVCRALIPHEECYARRFHGRNFFRLTDKQHRELATSEMFDTTYKRETAIQHTKRDGLTNHISSHELMK